MSQYVFLSIAIIFYVYSKYLNSVDENKLSAEQQNKDLSSEKEDLVPEATLVLRWSKELLFFVIYVLATLGWFTVVDDVHYIVFNTYFFNH